MYLLLVFKKKRTFQSNQVGDCSDVSILGRSPSIAHIKMKYHGLDNKVIPVSRHEDTPYNIDIWSRTET
jgi:hypothetical protein